MLHGTVLPEILFGRILVTVPVLLPGAQALGIHPIHFGMVCVIASAIGHVTPPVGLCLFLGMAIMFDLRLLGVTLTGVPMTELPFTPERVWRRIQELKEEPA